MDKLSLLVLKTYATRTSLDISQLLAVLDCHSNDIFEAIMLLRKQGYLRVQSNHASLRNIKNDDPITVHTPLEITFQGKAALEAEAKVSKEKRNEWIRYWITTAIAVAAFIKSFFF